MRSLRRAPRSALGRAGGRAPGACLPCELANRVLDHFGLRLDDWGGRIYVLRDRKGRSAVVDNLGVLWVEAERLAGRPSTRSTPVSCTPLAADGKLPVALVTGFLGSGKTTLIASLLGHPAMGETAVIVNELGEIGIDHHLLRRVDERTVLLKSGCVCCTLRGDLADELRDLLGRRERGEIPAFRRVVVETTGLADPAPVVYTLLSEPVVKHHLRARERRHDRRRAARARARGVGAAGRRRRHARRHEDGSGAGGRRSRAGSRGSTRLHACSRPASATSSRTSLRAGRRIRAGRSRSTTGGHVHGEVGAVTVVLDGAARLDGVRHLADDAPAGSRLGDLPRQGPPRRRRRGPRPAERRPARRPPAGPSRRLAGRRPPLAARLHRPAARPEALERSLAAFNRAAF